MRGLHFALAAPLTKAILMDYVPKDKRGASSTVHFRVFVLSVAGSCKFVPGRWCGVTHCRPAPGKFNAIESIGRVSWTGSAVIGGALIDAFSYVLPCHMRCRWYAPGYASRARGGIRYRVCFAVTGVIYAVALAALVPLIWLVPQEKDTIGGKPEAPTVHAASETDSEDPASS